MDTLKLLVLAIIFLVSCAKQQESGLPANSDWEIIWVKETLDSKQIQSPESIILSFTSGDNFTLKLNPNNCFGKYSADEINKISFDEMGCTRICCDSTFAGNTAGLLLKMKRFKVKENLLILGGEGAILLKRI